MKTPTPLSVAACALWLTATQLLAAPIPGLFNTGVDRDGVLFDGGDFVDPHYELVASADPSFPGPDAVTLNAGFPVPPWVAEGPDSRWISAQAASGNSAPGEYRFRTTFDLSGFDAESASIIGEWAVDDEGTDILLNGASTGNFNGNGFGGLTPFTISSGFVDGVNTLEFIVQNGGVDANPMGLRVKMRGTVEVPGEPPSIIDPPAGGFVFEGESFSLTVLADGEPPLSYQWQLEGADIDGATADSYQVAAAVAADAGDYTVVVSNASGSATSDPAAVAVGQEVPGVFPTGVDDFGVVLADGMVDAHYQIVTNPDSPSPQAFVHDSTVFPIVTGPWLANDAFSKWISPRVDTVGAAGGDYAYEIGFDLTGFNPATAFVEGRWSSDNGGLDIRVNGVSTGHTTAGFTAWSSFSIPPGNFVSGANTLEFVLNNASAGYTGLRVDSVRAGAVPGGGTTGPPTILRPPADQLVPIGSRASFSVLADGAQPLAYQWRFEGEDIPGATGPELEFASVAEGDAGSYDVVISNGEGSITSDAVELTILRQPPEIITQPADAAAVVGDQVIFSVVAQGTQPISYQWRFNGEDLPGRTGAELVLDSVGILDVGEYEIVLTNSDGMLTSEVARLVLLDPVPGVFSTGVDDDGLPLGDNLVDPHYQLVVSANGGGADALAMGSIPSPPWVANSTTSRWIGPTPDAGGAPGLYTFQTSFDLLGFDVSTVVVTASWATDNGGTELRLNGVPTGITHPGTFDTLIPFTIDSGFVEGTNTLEFDVMNAGEAANPIGLRVENLRALGVATGVPRFEIVAVSRNAEGRVSFTWNSVPGATYSVFFSHDLSAWSELDDAVLSGGTSTSYMDIINDPGAALRYYRVLRTE